MEAIEKTVLLNANIENVWQAVTHPDQLSKWMLMECNFNPEKDKKFVFQTEPNETWDGKIKCNLMEYEENKKIEFTWNSDHIQFDTLVSITLQKKNDKTELTLIHNGWDYVPVNSEEMRDKHNEGWELRINEKLPNLLNNRG